MDSQNVKTGTTPPAWTIGFAKQTKTTTSDDKSALTTASLAPLMGLGAIDRSMAGDAPVPGTTVATCSSTRTKV